MPVRPQLPALLEGQVEYISDQGRPAWIRAENPAHIGGSRDEQIGRAVATAFARAQGTGLERPGAAGSASRPMPGTRAFAAGHARRIALGVFAYAGLSRGPTEVSGRRRAIRRAFAGALALVVVTAGLAAVLGGRSGIRGLAGSDIAAATPNGVVPGMVKMLGGTLGPHKNVSLPRATTAPAPSPPSLASAAPLRPHEVFGFAPYWTLDQSGAFNVGGMTTLAYFSVGINPDGTLDQSDSGWNGYESQALADLVTRAHAGGDRVVLTVSCFSQASLDALTSSPTAPITLGDAVLAAIKAKNLDGVNLDLEGSGSGDQRGLTNLVDQVSSTIHGSDPHYQVTMDTYASSAGDPSGFYNIKALAPAVDGFFVMAYQLNLQATPSTVSPLTSPMFSDLTTLKQYTAAVPASKVILGVPYYGYDWPTTDGTLSAQATGDPSPVSYAQVVAGSHPVYWDATTDTAWTAYQVGTQWHETFFEDPSSLYLEAQLSQFFQIAGLGIWALGYDGNDPQMLAALDGFAPVNKDGSPPASPPSSSPTTTTTAGPVSPGSGDTTSPPPVGADPGTAPVSSPTVTTTTTPVGTVPPSSPPTSTTTVGGTPAPSLWYSGTWQGQSVALTEISSDQPLPSGTPTYLGQLTGFQSNDPSVSCLATEPAINVWQLSDDPGVDIVEAEQPTDCVTVNFSFPDLGTPQSAASPIGSTVSGAGRSVVRSLGN